MSEYYVYIHCDPRKLGIFTYGDYSFDYEPFYVGKGKASTNRAYIHITYAKNTQGKSTNHHRNRLRGILNESLEPIILILHDNLTHEQSCAKEIEIITLIGRQDLSVGPLLNLTNGGEGSYGRILSEDTKKKISDNHADFTGEKHPSFGMKRSEETRKKIGETSSGRKHSEEIKLRIAESVRRTKAANKTLKNNFIQE